MTPPTAVIVHGEANNPDDGNVYRLAFVCFLVFCASNVAIYIFCLLEWTVRTGFTGLAFNGGASRRACSSTYPETPAGSEPSLTFSARGSPGPQPGIESCRAL